MDKSSTEKLEHCTINMDNAEGEKTGLENGGIPPVSNHGSPASLVGARATQGDGGIQSKEKPLEFRSDAKIWQLYLEDAEREAKDRMELWKTSLDSLLIFSGLFAGIVSSFLIDARRDLQENSEQNLLSSIRTGLFAGIVSSLIVDARRDLPTDPEQNIIRDIQSSLPGMSVGTEIPGSQRAINGLWLLSLYITLFSAIMGVLAKAWLAKFVPATTRHEAKAARKRYTLDKQAERWHLDEVITLIPFLVQLAAFLFLCGLVVQSMADDKTLGRMLLGFFTLGCAVYLTLSFFPAVTDPDPSPFNTPLSDLLSWYDKIFSTLFRPAGSESSPKSLLKGDTNERLAEILYEKLIKSQKQKHVDAAAAEIALSSFDERWIEYLCRNDTAHQLLMRCEKRASTGNITETEKSEILCNYLLAFLRFVENVEEKRARKSEQKPTERLAVGPANTTDSQAVAATPEDYKSLLDVLKMSLEPKYPFHRWNSLPESSRLLLFGLRTQVLSTLGTSPTVDGVELDFRFDEISESPWEMALQEITPNHRVHFMLAACRGLLQGEKNLKTTSTFILGLSLAKAGWDASGSGRISEWDGRIVKEKRDDINTLLQEILSELHTATTAELEGMVTTASNMLSIFPGSHASDRQEPLKTLVASLNQPRFRIHSIKMINQALIQGHPLRMGTAPFPFGDISDTVVCGDEHVRTDGLNILANLLLVARREDLALGTTALLASVDFGLNRGSEHQFLNTIEFISALNSGGRHPLQPLVTEFMPGLLKTALTDSLYYRRPAMRLAEDMWSEGSEELKLAIKDAIPKALNAGLAHQSRSRDRILSDLTDMVKDSGPKLPLYAFVWRVPGDMVQDVFPVVLENILTAAIHDKVPSVNRMARDLLEMLFKNGVTEKVKADALAWLVKVQPDREWRVRQNVVDVGGSLIGQLSPTALVVDFNKALLNKLLGWAVSPLTDEEVMDREVLVNARNSCVEKILTIVHTSNPELQETVKSTILSVRDGIIEEPSPPLRYHWVRLLSDMVKHVSFPQVVSIILKLYMKTGYKSKLWENAYARKDFLMLGKCEADPAYINELESTRPDLPSAKWIRLLVGLAQRPALKECVDKILKDSSNYEIQKPSEPESDTQDAQVQDDKSAKDFMRQSKLKLPLRTFLYNIGENNRRTWVDILATIAAHCREFPFTSLSDGVDTICLAPSIPQLEDAHTILFEIAKYDTDSKVQSACLRFLKRLANHSVTIGGLTNDIIDHFDHFISHSHPRVRFHYTQLLFTVGISKEGGLPDKVLEELSARASSDPDADCRSEAINTFSGLVGIDNGDQHPSLKERYRTSVDAMVKGLFRKGVKEDDWKVRRSWIKLVGTQIEEANFPYLTELFDATIKDVSLDVQAEAMTQLQRLLKHDDAKLRARIAAKLGKALGSPLRTPEHTNRVVTVMMLVTKPQKEDTDELHQLWIQIAILIGQNVGSQALSNLFEAVIKEETRDNIFESLDDFCSFFEDVQLPRQIADTVPKAIESSLKLDAMPKARLGAVNVFGTLMGCVPDRGDNQPRYERLLGPNYNSAIIFRLAEIVVKDDDDDLRTTALKILMLAFEAPALSTFVKTSLTKIIKDSLKDHDNSKHRANAVSAVNTLTKENMNDQYRDIVSPSISQLLSMVLLEGDDEIWDRVANVLRNFTVSAAETKLNRDVLVAIPPLVAAITTLAGKEIIMELTDRVAISPDTAFRIACELTPKLKSTPTFARAAVIELLMRLYTKHRLSKPRLIESAIPEIISLAFDDKDDVGGIRITAIQLLVALSSGSDPELLSANLTLSHSHSHPFRRPGSSSSSVLSQITPLATRFMGLLQVKHLRSSVVELLSLMSLDDTARKAITLRIASVVFGPDSPALVGYVELLARLISDGRLGEKATDYMMLFLAPVLATRPQLSRFRFEILTALWSRYSRRPLWTNGDASRKSEGTEEKTVVGEERKNDIQEVQRGDIEGDTNGNQSEDIGKGQEGLEVKTEERKDVQERQRDNIGGTQNEETQKGPDIEKERKKEIQEGERGNIRGNRKEDTGNPNDNTGKEQKDVEEEKEQQRHEVQKLVEWLALALFGRHVRLHEAQAWKKRCGRYLEAKKG